MCANDVLSHRSLGKYSSKSACFAFPCTAVPALMIVLLVDAASGDTVIPTSIRWFLSYRLDDLSLSPTPVASHFSAAQAAGWFTPSCLRGVRLVVRRCFWDLDGCEWWFGDELTGRRQDAANGDTGLNAECDRTSWVHVEWIACGTPDYKSAGCTQGFFSKWTAVVITLA